MIYYLIWVINYEMFLILIIYILRFKKNCELYKIRMIYELGIQIIFRYIGKQLGKSKYFYIKEKGREKKLR